MEEIDEEYASVWNAVYFFEGGFLRSDLLPLSHHWSMGCMDWKEEERERTEKGAYLGEVLVLVFVY